MNLSTLSQSTKVIKKLQSTATGQIMTSKDTPIIAIINACEVDESKRLVDNLVAGVKANGGVVFNYNVPYFGYANKLNPMTAKFASSFISSSKTNAQAIIKSNMIEGVVIISDCDVTVTGLLQGCTEINCPAVVLPLGTVGTPNAYEDKPVTQIAGVMASGKINASKCDEIVTGAFLPKQQSGFFTLLEKLGFCVKGASENKRGNGLQLLAATESGVLAVKYTNDLRLPKKAFVKTALPEIIDLAFEQNIGIEQLELVFSLFEMCDVKANIEATKTAPANLVKVTGTALGGTGYVQFTGNRPAPFEGKAWVYQTLEDADRALCSGNVPEGSVVVLHNCVGSNVTSIANVILGMGSADSIAIATDGYCDICEVLCVQIANPTSLENEEFANIQNGDTLDIDCTKGRFNSNVLAKDLKIRSKKNTTKKVQKHF